MYNIQCTYYHETPTFYSYQDECSFIEVRLYLPQLDYTLYWITVQDTIKIYLFMKIKLKFYEGIFTHQ